jgi:NPCBM/NEW2 domain/Beta-galactosidase jelly roll domain/NPCBM-associated, NEW3 domain of alpha-galactosidase
VELDLPPGQDTSIGLTFTDDPSRKYRVEIFVNGWMMGNYVNYLGPQHSFPIPNGILRTNGENTIALAVWNLDGTTGGLGKVKLTDYGTYASSLRVRDVASPGYSAATYAMPAAPGTTVRLAVPATTGASQTFTATTTVRVPVGSSVATSVKALLELPSGWTATPQTPVSIAQLQPGQAFSVRWSVTAPAGTLPQASAIRTVVHYRQDGKRQSNFDERIVRAVPPPPPAGTDAVSDLPFVSSTNGWGPVERDTSNGESAAGDGKTITINGVTYTKGLGTNSTSDVSVYLAGKCTSFSADVGVDDETNGGGTVTFRVVGDGTTLASTGTIKAHTAAQHITADVTGVQLLELVVGDAGDGNGLDHGDWAMPTLTCT